jgi:hypothetical protein
VGQGSRVSRRCEEMGLLYASFISCRVCSSRSSLPPCGYLRRLGAGVHTRGAQLLVPIRNCQATPKATTDDALRVLGHAGAPCARVSR